MQSVFWIMFAVTILVAAFYWIKYEKECEHTYELEDKICEMNCELKKRTQLVMIGDLVQEYKRGGNVFTIMRKISDIVLTDKVKELAPTPIDNKF